MKQNRLILAAVFLLFEGCASLTPVDLFVNSISKPVSMTPNINRQYQIIKHIEAEQKAPLLFIQRIVPGEGGKPDLDEMLRHEFASTKGDAIVNVKIKGRTKAGDFLLPIVVGIGGGLLFPPFYLFTVFPLYEDLKTYTIEGDIVQYVERKPPLEIKEEQFEPVTSVPAKSQKTQFDPETGLPIKVPDK